MYWRGLLDLDVFWVCLFLVAQRPPHLTFTSLQVLDMQTHRQAHRHAHTHTQAHRHAHTHTHTIYTKPDLWGRNETGDELFVMTCLLPGCSWTAVTATAPCPCTSEDLSNATPLSARVCAGKRSVNYYWWLAEWGPVRVIVVLLTGNKSGFHGNVGRREFIFPFTVVWRMISPGTRLADLKCWE